jgi:hypothetical protein
MPNYDLPGILDRFAVAVPESGCWLWVGSLNSSDGYGKVEYGGRAPRRKKELAHRFVYKLAFGPIPPGMVVCHKCDVTCCVNPNHLFVGTVGDNNRDRNRKGRTARGNRNGRAKLTPDLVRQIRASRLSGRLLGWIVGISGDSISAARRGENWGHVA